MKLEAQGLVKRFGQHAALDGVTFATRQEARVVVLLGPSGGGKSTLLRVLGALLPADAGSVQVDGVEVPRQEAAALAMRRRLGYVFQGYNLFPHLTARENIALPLRVVHGLEAAEAVERADAWLRRLGLAAHGEKRPAQLSGGQQQRAALARALAPAPQLLLLDEPTSALDPEMTAEVLDVVLELAREGQQLVLATHEVSFARRVADAVVFLAEGKVAEHGPADAFFREPSTAVARAYLQGLSRYR